MCTVFLIKLKDDKENKYPKLQVFAQYAHDAERAYCEYLNLEYDYYDANDWEFSQELDRYSDYDIEA